MQPHYSGSHGNTASISSSLPEASFARRLELRPGVARFLAQLAFNVQQPTLFGDGFGTAERAGQSHGHAPLLICGQTIDLIVGQ